MMSLQNRARIFLFWTGDNDMSPNRKRCLETFYANNSCDIVFVDNTCLQKWLLYDLHPAYPYLSYTHRADYLRCYFMHYYGGGYSDIKACSFDWSPYFNRLFSSPSLLMCGYRESRAEHIASSCNSIRLAYQFLPGMGHFIFKPQSPLTLRWISLVHSSLDALMDRLVLYPGTYHPRAVLGGVHGHEILPKIRYYGSRYPLQWNSILGRILHPLSFEFQANLCLSMPAVDTSSAYR